MKFLKIMGCVFCSLMIFGGIIATITNPNVTSIIMLIIFMGCDILLIKNLLKQKNQNKKQVETSQVIAIDDMQNMNLIQTENQQRNQKFHKTKILKSVFSTICVIDENNKLFYFAFKEGKPSSQYYAFDEVKSYYFESIGEKYITKSKHGVGRAVVGGALFGATGAIVGASTSKKETKVVPETTVLKIVLSHPNGECIETLSSPPLGLSTFLDKCISLNNKADIKSAVSEADEILKFKDLLDEGVITQEEFEIKKKQLIGDEIIFAPQQKEFIYDISYNTINPSKNYEVNDLETIFFETLHSKLYTENLFYTPSLIRMTDGTLAVEYGGYPVGKIKLQGRKYWMQVLKNLYDNDIIEGSIDDFIAHQNEWVKYIKKYLLKELK